MTLYAIGVFCQEQFDFVLLANENVEKIPLGEKASFWRVIATLLHPSIVECGPFYEVCFQLPSIRHFPLDFFYSLNVQITGVRKRVWWSAWFDLPFCVYPFH